jgi:hypothetical protein
MTIILISITALVSLTCLSTLKPHSYIAPAEVEFDEYKLGTRALDQHREFIDAAVKMLVQQQDISETTVKNAEKAVRISAATDVRIVMFRVKYVLQEGEPHTTIFRVKVSPNLRCRFAGVLDY